MIEHLSFHRPYPDFGGSQNLLWGMVFHGSHVWLLEVLLLEVFHWYYRSLADWNLQGPKEKENTLNADFNKTKKLEGEASGGRRYILNTPQIVLRNNDLFRVVERKPYVSDLDNETRLLHKDMTHIVA